LIRAEARIEEAILNNDIKEQSPQDDIEITSFPIAVMMVAASENAHLKRRYALAEAKRVSNLLNKESKETISAVASYFNWNLKDAKTPAYDFVLRFPNFLKNAVTIQDKRWKLVNRLMLGGEVFLNKNEVSRLLQEEVRRYIEGKLNIEVGEIPQNVVERVERIKRLFSEVKGKIQSEEMPKEVVIDAFPPCIRELRNKALTGRHISHVGRFTLTSFLINSGMSVGNVVDCFRSSSDFNERMTRYQAEHIAGQKGSRTRYIPPKCDTLRTHGVCPGMDDTCRAIHHPLRYYGKKIQILKTKTET